ncbi:TadE family protein [Nesterenkonia sp. NBAIMH1]|uniref:TadE family protein n=1 Tax=Nesterenkonia sp. NBAIMH1 TaxID=2600320 RepID=UPI0011B3C7AC|nr:TadE/TadG family type IV pilus assembly protein [Nesterenkonia sp. NBAIMH1]
MRARTRDRGASAVEFALVAPVLVAMLLGILAFGHAFHVQSVLSNAARDGVRIMALADTSDDSDPVTAATERTIASAAPSANVSDSDITLEPSGGCETGGTATLKINYPLELLGLGTPITLTGKGTMRCNG